ncbi:MAG: anhydro-N-acetylmuramic acid kinase, partial [Burkholderiales bacterium]|nr:anhydro-N-acetylmuramic acid kinase [Burkholderiales bacterium]
MLTHYIGLMSGTSLDGIDGVILRREGPTLSVTHAVHWDMPADLRSEFMALNSAGINELHRASLAANDLMRGSTWVVQRLLSEAGLPPSAIRAIGAHGQTVRHRPAAPGEYPHVDAPWTAYTLQLNNPALLAELTGITVVADFRSRDVAAGGQGAPLVPAFHRAVFSKPGTHVAVVNIGGMANVTLLPSDGSVTGFDTGPGNVLMDIWCERHTGQRYDADGAWGAQGR